MVSIISTVVVLVFTLFHCQKFAEGAMFLTLQLQNYTNPNMVLNASAQTSCAQKIPSLDNALINNCNFQFSTVLTRINQPATTINTHLIPPDSTGFVNFSQTNPSVGCNQQYYNVSHFNCNDSTWVMPIYYAWADMPLSIQILVTHYGRLVYKNEIVSDALIPSTNWFVDSFYVNMRNVVPYSFNNTSPPSVTYMIGSSTNNGNSVYYYYEKLGLSLISQCAKDYYGPTCNFTDCQKIDGSNSVQCKANDNSGYLWKCHFDTTYLQATNCEFCPNGFNGEACLSANTPPINLASNTTGLTAGVIVLAIVAAIELLIIIVGVVLMCRKKKQASSSSTNRPTTVQPSSQKKYTRPAPAYDPDNEAMMPSDEYSRPSPRNGDRREAAV